MNRHRILARTPHFLKAVAISLVVCVAIAMSNTANAQTVFEDDTFDDANWTAEVFFTSGNGGSGSGTQVLTGGNPDAYRSVTHSIASRPVQVGVVHEPVGATYDPQVQGAIDAISYSFDARTFADPGYGGQSATLAIRQNGIVYCGPFFANGAMSWVTTSQVGLVATNFKLFDGTPSHPDFSSSGGVIQFGLVTSNTNPPNGIIGGSTTVVGYDNWSVTITPVSTGVTDGRVPIVRKHMVAPNPFSRGTVIHFALEQPAQVRIRVFDVLGRRVRDLTGSNLAAGSHVVGWDGRNAAGLEVPAGAYLYRIDAGGPMAFGRMTLVR